MTWFHWDSTAELYNVPRPALFPEIAALAGVDALVDAANAPLEAGRTIEAIHLLEIVEVAEPTHAGGLAAHKKALTTMRDEALATTNNTYEIDWLSYRLRALSEIDGEG